MAGVSLTLSPTDFGARIGRVAKAVKAAQTKALRLCGVLVQGRAKQNASRGNKGEGRKNPQAGPKTLRRGKGQLAASIQKAEKAQLVEVGTNVVYAAIQEKGGTIRPKSAKALAVPVHPDARKAKGPRDFDDLTMIQRSGHAPVLVRSAGKRKARTDIMYVLLKSVTLPARPFLEPALDDSKTDISTIFQREIGNAMAEAVA